jgi:hypothetical protein
MMKEYVERMYLPAAAASSAKDLLNARGDRDVE